MGRRYYLPADKLNVLKEAVDFANDQRDKKPNTALDQLLDAIDENIFRTNIPMDERYELPLEKANVLEKAVNDAKEHRNKEPNVELDQLLAAVCENIFWTAIPDDPSYEP